MRCYFMKDGRIRRVEAITALSDADALGQARALFRDRRDRTFDGFELWNHDLVIHRHDARGGDNSR